MIVKSLLGIFLAILLLSITEQAPARRKERPIFGDRVEKFLQSMTNEGLNDREKIKYLGEILSALSYYKYNDPNYLEHCVGQKIIQDGYRDVQRYGDHQQYSRNRNRDRYSNNIRGNTHTSQQDEDYNDYDYNDDIHRDHHHHHLSQGDNRYGGVQGRYPSKDLQRHDGGSSQGRDRGTQVHADGIDDYSEYDDEEGDQYGRTRMGDNSGDRSRSWYNDNLRGTPNPSQGRVIDGHASHDGERDEDGDSYDDYSEYDNDDTSHHDDQSNRYQDNQYGRTQNDWTTDRSGDRTGDRIAYDQRTHGDRTTDRSGDRTRDRTAYDQWTHGDRSASNSYDQRGRSSYPSQEHGIDGHGTSDTHAHDHDEYDEYEEQDNHDQHEDLQHHENYDYYDQDEEDDAEDDHSNQEQSIDGHDPHRTSDQWGRDRNHQSGSQGNQINQSTQSRGNGYSDRSPGSSHGQSDAQRGNDPHRISQNTAHGGRNDSQSGQDHNGYQYRQHGIHGEPYVPYGEHSPYMTGEAMGDHSGDYNPSQYDPYLVEEYLSRIHLQGVPSDLAEYANSYLQYTKDSVRAAASHAKDFEKIRPCLEHLTQYFNVLTDDLASEYRRCSNKCYYDRLETFSNSVSQYTTTTNECIQNRLY